MTTPTLPSHAPAAPHRTEAGRLAPRPDRATHGPLVLPRIPRAWLPVGLVVAFIPLALWMALRPDDAITRPARFPAVPPAEWSADASWASPPLAANVPPVPLADSSTVLVTAERRIMLVASDGSVRWRDRLPDGDIHGAPFASQVAGAPVVALHVGTALAWWRVDGGESGRLDVPPGTVVLPRGEVPLAVLPDGRAYAVTGPHPEAVRLPAGSRALAAHTDGAITAAGPDGWWHVDAAGTATGGPWEGDGGPTPTVVDYAAGHLVLVRPGSPVTLEVHVDRRDDVRFVFAAPLTMPDGTGNLTWTPSPDGRWGVLGRTLVDLRTAAVRDLGAWRTDVVTADRAYGRIADQLVVAGPDIPRGVVVGREAVPAAITPAGALVVTTDPDSHTRHAYLLPPRRTR